VTAFCHRCGDGTPGLFSWRHHGPINQQVAVGGANAYIALCRPCYLHEIRGPVHS
jgi:thymidine kinase